VRKKSVLFSKMWIFFLKMSIFFSKRQIIADLSKKCSFWEKKKDRFFSGFLQGIKLNIRTVQNSCSYNRGNTSRNGTWHLLDFADIHFQIMLCYTKQLHWQKSWENVQKKAENVPQFSQKESIRQFWQKCSHFEKIGENYMYFS